MPRAYRPELMTNYSPVFHGVPGLPLEVTADGGELVCIKTNPDMIPYLVTAWELFRYDYFLRGTQDEIDHTHRELMTLLSQIMTAEPCEDCPDCPDCPPAGGGGGGGGVQLPDCIEIVQSGNEFVINIRESETCMVTINVYEQGCGCGGDCGCGGSSGGGGSFGGGQSGGGGASGSWLVEPDQTVVAVPEGITQCDFATTTMPLVLDSIKEFVQVIDDNAENLQEAVDAAAAASDTSTLWIGDIGAALGEVVSGVIAAGSAAILAMLLDNDFRLRVQTAWIRAHGADGYITSVTRQDFFDTTRYLPLVYNQLNAPGTILSPRVLFPIFWRILNINKVNSRLIIAKGTGQTGLCEYLYAEANMTYTAPTAGTVDNPLFPSEEILLGTYAWAHTWDLRVEKFVDDAAFTYDDVEGSYWEWIEGIGYRGVPQAASPSFNRIKMFFIRNGAAPDPLICWVEYAFVHDPNSAYIDQIIGNTNFGAVDFNGVREVETPGVDGNNFHLWLEADDANVGESGGGISGSVVLARFAVAGNGLDFFANVTTETP